MEGADPRAEWAASSLNGACQHGQIGLHPCSPFVVDQIKIDVEFLAILCLAPDARLKMRFVGRTRFWIDGLDRFADAFDRVFGERGGGAVGPREKIMAR